MARWQALVRMRKTQTRTEAEVVADHLYGEDLVELREDKESYVVLVRLPDAKQRSEAEKVAAELHGTFLIRVLSVAEEQIARGEQEAIERRPDFPPLCPGRPEVCT